MNRDVNPDDASNDAAGPGGEMELTGYDNVVYMSVRKVVADLAMTIKRMHRDPRTIAMVNEFWDHRYFQMLSGPHGVLHAEVLSNLNIADLTALSPAAEASLRELGFAEPVPFLSPNWRFTASTVTERAALVEKLTSVIYDVLGEDPDNSVAVRSWSLGYTDVEEFEDFQREGRHYLSDTDDEDHRAQQLPNYVVITRPSQPSPSRIFFGDDPESTESLIEVGELPTNLQGDAVLAYVDEVIYDRGYLRVGEWSHGWNFSSAALARLGI